MLLFIHLTFFQFPRCFETSDIHMQYQSWEILYARQLSRNWEKNKSFQKSQILPQIDHLLYQRGALFLYDIKPLHCRIKATVKIYYRYPILDQIWTRISLLTN